ncbi:hypothetical protein CE91St41_01270 [Oscillospiraceae bacterium]|nr:hypothetical protein CE91St40_01270 [Oscillospiraceae bacterium]BDF73238.1 hypothetical protein CE91St41_01270 [Oscillospiraceae bacterium]
MVRRVVTASGNGERIFTARVYNGMSMRDLAEKAGVSASAIHKIESGESGTVRPVNARKICAALGKSFDDLFTIKEKEPERKSKDVGSDKPA